MMRRLGRFALLLGLIVGGTAGFARVWEHDPRQPATPVRKPLLSVPAAALDLGEVWEDERFAWVVPVTNRGQHPVHISAVRTNCQCVSAEPRSFTVPPGQTRPIRLSVNLAAKDGEATIGSRTFSTTIDLATRSESAPPAHETIHLTARVRPVLEIRPRAPVFGIIPDAATAPPAATFRVAALTPLECLTAVSESPGFEASTLPSNPDSPDEFLVSVTATAPRPVGALEAVVRLVPLAPGGRPLPERMVKLAGAVVPDVAAEPPVISIGARPVGETAAEAVCVSSRTGREVRITAVTSEGHGLVAERLDDRRVQVRQHVASAGDFRGQVILTAEPAGGPPVEVVVPVIGYGTGSR